MKNILVIPVDACRAGVWSLTGELLSGIKYLLNLPLDSLGGFPWVWQLEESLAHGVFQLHSPQVDQWLVCVQKPPLAIKDVREVGDRGEHRGIDVPLLLQALAEIEFLLLRPPALGDVFDGE